MLLFGLIYLSKLLIYKSTKSCTKHDELCAQAILPPEEGSDLFDTEVLFKTKVIAGIYNRYK